MRRDGNTVLYRGVFGGGEKEWASRATDNPKLFEGIPPFDEDWTEATENANRENRFVLEGRLSTAQSRLHKDAIRMAYLALAEHDARTAWTSYRTASVNGALFRAMDCCASRFQTAQIGLLIIESAINAGDFAIVKEYAERLGMTRSINNNKNNSGGGGGNNNADNYQESVLRDIDAKVQIAKGIERMVACDYSAAASVLVPLVMNGSGDNNSNNNNNNNNDTTPILLEEKADCSSFYNDCFDPYYTKIDAWGGDPEGREYYEYFQDTLPVHSLYLRANGLSGTIPDELGLLTNVYKEIHMGSNEMFGPVPSHIGMLSMLQRLSFESNELASTLPTELGQMTHIRSFDISSNYAIKGAFPTEFGRLTNIEKFQVQNTNLSGGVPPEFCEMIETRSAELSQDNVELVFRASCEKYFRCTCCTECCVQQLNAVDKCVVPHLAVP